MMISNSKHPFLKDLYITLIIGVSFLWTGAGYLSWLYHLMEFCDETSADILSEVVGYLFQVLGLIAVVTMVRTKKLRTNAKGFCAFVVADLVFMVAASFVPGLVPTLILGYGMNFLHGVVAAYYLLLLAGSVSSAHRGRCFGCGYAIGSIGTWALSLFSSENFLTSPFVNIVYAAFVAVLIVLTILGKDLFACLQKDAYAPLAEVKSTPKGGKVILLAVCIVFLFSMEKNISFYFPMADLSGAGISLEFSRAFYALGLIAAGFLNDKNRLWGAIGCVIALIFPFISAVLIGNMQATLAVWILGYIFYGFFVVYRTVLFCDLAEMKPEWFYLAPVGLLVGRVGDALGAFVGKIATMYVANASLVTLGVSVVFFALSVVAFFSLYHHIYVQHGTISVENDAELDVLLEKYGLSKRELEVAKLMLEGVANPEISTKLFISENTVKFHVKNILKKTGCSNRTELSVVLSRQKIENNITTPELPL